MNSNHKSQAPLRIGIVGCGRVAEYHARFIKGLSDAQMVAVADKNEAAVRQFAAAHQIPVVCGTVEELLSAEIDVLHVITPPAFHYECARAALERGVHVFVEKPVAFTAREVTDLYERAASRGLVLCPDFLQLFHPKMQELIARLDSGDLGRVVHVETGLHVNLDQSPEILEAEGIHWAYRLPGGLLRDYTSHLLYMAMHFAGLPNNIHVSRNSRGTLPQGMIDHLTVHIEGAQSTATVVLSCLPRPSAYYLRLFCEKGSAEVNFETQSLLVTRQSGLPRRIVSATANYAASYKLFSQGTSAIVNYLRGKLVPYAGMQALLPRFYASIRIPRLRRFLPTWPLPWYGLRKRFFRLRGAPLRRLLRPFQPGRRPAIPTPAGDRSQWLRRRPRGESDARRWLLCRALVRPTGSPERLAGMGVEVFLGDVRRLDDVSAAAEGMDVIVHMAAGMKGSPEFMVDSCVRGTQNVAEAAARQKVKRVIYMSSLSVYDYSAQRSGSDFTETSPLESQAESRGAYSLGKRRAEESPWPI